MTKNDPKMPPKTAPRRLQDDTFSKTNSKTNSEAKKEGQQGGLNTLGGTRGRRCSAAGSPTLRHFLRKFSPRRGRKYKEFKGCSRGSYNTPYRAAQGAADLERPAGEHRRPLAGMFRVQVALDSHSDVVHDGLWSCSGTLGVSLAVLGPLAVTKQVATTYLLVFRFTAATREEERKKEGSRRRRTSRSRRWRRRRQGKRRKRTEDRVLHESCGTCHEIPQQKRSFFKQVTVLAEEARTCSSKAILGGLWGARGGLWEGLGGSGAGFGEVQGGLWGAPGRS